MPSLLSTNNIDNILGKLEPVMLFPFFTVWFIVLFYIYYVKISRPLPYTSQWIDREVNKPRFSCQGSRHPMEKRDIAPLAIITAVFAFLAFFKLGDTTAPKTFFQFSQDQKSITIELDRPEKITSMMFYTGLWTGYYELEFSPDGSYWYEQSPDPGVPDRVRVYAMDQSHAHLFKWRYAVINNDNPDVKFIRITSSRAPIELGELALYGSDGALIPQSRIASPDAPNLFDEQELVPERPTYMNGMYFDEIYHGRTALEHLRSITPYEITHPPLGKEIIATSINVFGMTPFGWRFPGALFGVIMLVVLYIFIKNMFGKTIVAGCGTLLLGFDFMRFTQTRIATIDTYGVFFILLAYFFMYRYMTTDSDAPFRKSLAPLALSGAAFGLGCASKWIAIYAGAGLAILYTIRLVLLYRHYYSNRRTGFSGYLIKTLLFSLLFFCVVPAGIYFLSYIPYGIADGMTLKGGMLWNPRYFEIIRNNQVTMFVYHSKTVLDKTHPYSSHWWQWILDLRPILYFNSRDGGLRSTIAAFGNPVVWWGGLVAMLAMGVRMVVSRDMKAMFIVIGFLSQLIPWLPVNRIVFIYHYFPSTLFLVLALAHLFNTIIDSGRPMSRQVVYSYTAASGVLFAIFFPVLTGISVSSRYFSDLLKWIPGSWPF